MTKPLLLVDVDGVLAPFGGHEPPPGHRLYRLAPDIEVWLNPRHGLWLNALATWFELVWATAWEERAATLIAPVLGLPPLPVINFGTVKASTTWKLEDVRRYAKDRPAAWIDDDLGTDAAIWADQRSAPTLLVPTVPHIGFVEEHVMVLGDFGRKMMGENP